MEEAETGVNTVYFVVRSRGRIFYTGRKAQAEEGLVGLAAASPALLGGLWTQTGFVRGGTRDAPPNPSLRAGDRHAGDAAGTRVGKKAFLLRSPIRSATAPPVQWLRRLKLKVSSLDSAPAEAGAAIFHPGTACAASRPRATPPRGPAPSPLTRRLDGLWPGAAGVAEHGEAEVAQALTNRVRQLHGWPARAWPLTRRLVCGRQGARRFPWQPGCADARDLGPGLPPPEASPGEASGPQPNLAQCCC